HDAHVLFELKPPWSRRRLLEAAQQLRDDPFPLTAMLPDGPPALLPLIGDVSVTGTVEKEILLLRRQVAPGGLEVDAEGLGYPLEDVPPPPPHAAPPAAGSAAMMREPSAKASACSTASASRGRTFGSFFRRSMTMAMSCLMRRSSFKSSVKRTTCPSTRARTKPRLSISSNRSLY